MDYQKPDLEMKEFEIEDVISASADIPPIVDEVNL